MHGFIKRFADGAFYPEEVQILVAAFDDAWAKLQSRGAPFAERAYARAAREILAKRIIMAAQRGERNRQRAAMRHWGLTASRPVTVPPMRLRCYTSV